MATMTEAQIQTAWANAVKILDEDRKFGAVNATNLINLIATYEASYGGDFIQPAETAIQACRQAIAGVLAPGYIQAVLRPWLQQYMLSVVGLTNLSNDAQMLQQLYVSLAQRNLSVQSRNITYGTPTAITNVTGGANAGNGQIVRLTTDQWNYPIENIWCDQKIAQCVQDAQMGSKEGQELFSVQANVPYIDQIKRSGSGINTNFNSRTADDNNPGLFNASFDQFSSPTGLPSNPDGLTNWTSAAGDTSTQYTLDATNFYRVSPSTTEANSYSLTALVTNTFSQLISAKGTRLNQGTPYLTAIIYNSQINGATGTLTGFMGQANTSVVVDGLTGWRVLLVPGPVGQSCWPLRFGVSDPPTASVGFTYTKTGGSGLVVAEVLFLQAQPHDNTWYWSIPGSGVATPNPWKFGDQLRWADVDGGTGILQNFFWRAWNVYMPNRFGSSITWASV
jgi:hypothetical protein